MAESYYYGGQAVMEGVLMRGRKSLAVACRAPNGEIVVYEEDLKPGPVLRRVRNLPFVRGAVVLWDTLILGTRALMFSANVSLQEELEEEEPHEVGGFPWVSIVILLIAGALGLYFLAPFVIDLLNDVVASSIWEVGVRAALGLGVLWLIYAVVRSHRNAVARHESGLTPEPEALTGVLLWGTVAVSLLFAIGLFFVVPVGASAFLERFISSHFVVNVLEGVLRLAMLVGYLWLISQMEDIRRVFAYHGAEHKTINAHEKGLPLDVEHVRPQPLEHIRCGTGFLLLVVLISVVIFVMLGRPPLLQLIASRVLLVPVIAAIGYEVIRFGAAHAESPVMRVILAPGLVLQRLTTREPEDEMLEVAIASFKRVAARDGIVAQHEIMDGAVPVNELGQPLEIPQGVAVAAAD